MYSSSNTETSEVFKVFRPIQEPPWPASAVAFPFVPLAAARAEARRAELPAQRENTRESTACSERFDTLF